MNQPQMIVFEEGNWPKQVATLMNENIEIFIKERGSCNVLLTGGRCAELLYRVWSTLPAFHQLHDIKFYFGDERYVSHTHFQSNYGMVMKTLFQHGIPSRSSVFGIEIDGFDQVTAARRYEEKLPLKIDLMLLSVGDVGHIASLFPRSELLKEKERRVMAAYSPKYPNERITITPLVLTQTKKILVLAMGNKKAILEQALIAPLEIDDLPARLVLNAIWLLNSPL